MVMPAFLIDQKLSPVDLPPMQICYSVVCSTNLQIAMFFVIVKFVLFLCLLNTHLNFLSSYAFHLHKELSD